MAVVVPSSIDGQLYELYQRITTLTNVIAANASNGPLVFKLTKDKANCQMQLVLGLLGFGAITAASVLAACTYSVPTQVGGDQV